MIPVLMSGGSGTRLWPVSRAQFPKQFCNLFGESLQIKTFKRLSHLGQPWVLTSQALRTLTEKELKLNHLSSEVLFEPFGKNTAPALVLLLKTLEFKGQLNEIIGVFPSDHLITKEEEFLKIVQLAQKEAFQGKVVTLGITPTYPETGYGYIQTNGGFKAEKVDLTVNGVLKFHEKPNLEKAKLFLAEGNYFWNAGIFIFKAQTMVDLFKKYAPKIWETFSSLKEDSSNLVDVYNSVENISIDYAIMEKLNSDELVCIPSDIGWDDVGSWDSVANQNKSNENENMISIASQGNYIHKKENKNYSLLGVSDLIVVDTEDALLISKKGESQNVKLVIDELKAQKSKKVTDHVFEVRPWGKFEILRDENHFKSKVIEVDPLSQISYQSHSKRAEHWIITKGVGEVILNDEVIPVKAGTHVFIPLGAKHRIRNISQHSLQFVEVQIGTYFGEDDIVRYQDDYKRS